MEGSVSAVAFGTEPTHHYNFKKVNDDSYCIGEYCHLSLLVQIADEVRREPAQAGNDSVLLSD